VIEGYHNFGAVCSLHLLWRRRQIIAWKCHQISAPLWADCVVYGECHEKFIFHICTFYFCSCKWQVAIKVLFAI